MIYYKNSDIVIDYDTAPDPSVDNTVGQCIVIRQLKRLLPEMLSPSSSIPPDLVRDFHRKLEYLRKFIQPEIRDLAADLFAAQLPAESGSPAAPENNCGSFSTNSAQEASDQADTSIPEPGSDPAPTRFDPGSDAAHDRLEPGSQTDRPQPAPDHTRTGPKSPLDDLPPEDQEQIYETILEHGYKPSIPILAQPRPAGLATTFAYSVLRRFRIRFQERRSEENRRLALQACDNDMTSLPRDGSPTELAHYYLQKRIVSAVFDPDLSEKQLGRVVMNLHRLRMAYAAERRLEIAEAAAFDKRRPKF